MECAVMHKVTKDGADTLGAHDEVSDTDSDNNWATDTTKGDTSTSSKGKVALLCQDHSNCMLGKRK